MTLILFASLGQFSTFSSIALSKTRSPLNFLIPSRRMMLGPQDHRTIWLPLFSLAWHDSFLENRLVVPPTKPHPFTLSHLPRTPAVITVVQCAARSTAFISSLRVVSMASAACARSWAGGIHPLLSPHKGVCMLCPAADQPQSLTTSCLTDL